jgi:hypothetical protein
VQAVGDGGDPAGHAAGSLGQEVLGLGVLEEWVLSAVQQERDIPTQRRDPDRVPRMQSVRQVNEAAEIGAVPDRPDRDLRRQITPSSLPIWPIVSMQ